MKINLTEKNLQLTSRYKTWQTIAFAFVLVFLLSLLTRSAFAHIQEDSSLIPDYAGTIVDDLSDDFSLDGPPRYWHEAIMGFKDHSWWTQNNKTGVENMARWALNVEKPGSYQIAVYIPAQHATTRQARYTLYHVGKTSLITVDQQTNPNSWVVLGEFEFNGTGNEFLELTDETGETDSAFEIGVDAVGYLSAGLSLEDKVSDALWGKVQTWLDDQTKGLRVQFEDWLAKQKGQLLRQLGNSLTGWIDQLCTGMGAAMILPILAFISWRVRRLNE